LFIEVYGNRPLPKITFVIIKKSHNTRFFAPNGQRITNMAAGTVIDTTIVHPRQFDFYLNSHAGALGTNVCSYYHVLYNEIEFTSDELQQLTFWVKKIFRSKKEFLFLCLFCSFVILMYVVQKLLNVQQLLVMLIQLPIMQDILKKNHININQIEMLHSK
jgi:hypothetical protein